MADLQNHAPANRFLTDRPRLCRMLSILCMFLGLTIASYPENKYEWMAWSKAQHQFLEPLLPHDPDFPRYASGIGLQLISLSFHFSPWSRDLLSNRYFLWLGKQSFAVYLLHGPMIRTVLVWMLYGFTVPADVRNEKGDIIHPKMPFPGGIRLLIALPFWIPMNYGLAMLWTTYVDPWCAKWTEVMVSYILQERDEKHRNGNLLPA